MDDKIPVITLYGPWATWIMLGWKTIETREHARFACLGGRTIGIHAGLKMDTSLPVTDNAYLTRHQLDFSFQLAREYRGCLLGTVFVKAIRKLSTAEDSRRSLIDCSAGNKYGLILERRVELPHPIKMRGGQGIFYVNSKFERI